MTITGAFWGLLFKRATSKGLKISLHFILFLGIGGFFYLFSSILNIIVLKYLPYTVVFPLTAITYIWTLLISYFFLKESITGKKDRWCYLYLYWSGFSCDLECQNRRTYMLVSIICTSFFYYKKLEQGFSEVKLWKLLKGIDRGTIDYT